MTQSNGATASLADAFKSEFARVQPLIAKEWPSLDAAALAGTEGDLERVVTLVAESTSQAQDAVRARLEALHALAMRPANHNAPPRPPRDPMIELLERLEKKTTELASELRGAVLPNARDKVKDNLIVSLLVAIGLGFILGIIFAISGGRRDR